MHTYILSCVSIKNNQCPISLLINKAISNNRCMADWKMHGIIDIGWYVHMTLCDYLLVVNLSLSSKLINLIFKTVIQNQLHHIFWNQNLGAFFLKTVSFFNICTSTLLIYTWMKKKTPAWPAAFCMIYQDLFKVNKKYMVVTYINLFLWQFIKTKKWRQNLGVPTL